MHDPDGVDDRHAVVRERAEQAVLAVRELVVDLLQRVERAVVLDEANDVPADSALDDREPLRLPLVERLVPGQVEEVRLAGPRDELDAHRGHANSVSNRSAYCGAVGSSSWRKYAKTSTPSSRSGRIRVGEVLELVLRVRRLAEAEVAERRVRVPVVHADAGRHVEAVPRLVVEVEGDAERRVERAEEEREEPRVRSLLHGDADRAEPLAEERDALLEHAELPREVRGQLDGEPEVRRRLGGPALEVPLGGQPVARRVQLDRREPLRVAAQELRRLRVGGVETGLPARVREAGSSDIGACYPRPRGSHARSLA